MHRLRRSIEKNHAPHSAGFQLIDLLENLSKQLNHLQVPTGRQREYPFQSCLDLHDQSKSGR